MPQTDKLHDARPQQVRASERRGKGAWRLGGRGRGRKRPVSFWAGLGVLAVLALVVNASSSLAALEHVVEPGDTLSALASRYGVTVEELAEVNRITNPNLIFVGDTLRIPDSSEGATGTTATSVPPMPPVISVPPPPSTVAPIGASINAPTVTPPPPPPIPGSTSTRTTAPTPTTLAPPSPPVSPTTQPTSPTPPVAAPPAPPTIAPPAPPTTEPVSIVSPNPPTTEPPAPAPTPTSSPPPAPDPQDADGDGQDDNAELTEGVESEVEWSPYTIRAGDWLSSIAERYDTTVEELARVNTLSNTNLIYIGQVILVPTSGTEGSPTGSASSPTDSAPSPTAGMTVEQRLDYWASHYNVPPEMLKALTWWESGWNNNAISSAGAIGIGQLLPSTADFVADVLIRENLNPYVVDDNIRMTARFVRYLLDETDNDRRLTLASYYQGLFAVRKYGIYNISIPYVNGILALQDRFR